MIKSVPTGRDFCMKICIVSKIYNGSIIAMYIVIQLDFVCSWQIKFRGKLAVTGTEH